jgi:hypothetical protein
VSARGAPSFERALGCTRPTVRARPHGWSEKTTHQHGCLQRWSEIRQQTRPPTQRVPRSRAPDALGRHFWPTSRAAPSTTSPTGTSSGSPTSSRRPRYGAHIAAAYRVDRRRLPDDAQPRAGATYHCTLARRRNSAPAPHTVPYMAGSVSIEDRLRPPSIAPPNEVLVESPCRPILRQRWSSPTGNIASDTGPSPRGRLTGCAGMSPCGVHADRPCCTSHQSTIVAEVESPSARECSREEDAGL